MLHHKIDWVCDERDAGWLDDNSTWKFRSPREGAGVTVTFEKIDAVLLEHNRFYPDSMFKFHMEVVSYTKFRSCNVSLVLKECISMLNKSQKKTILKRHSKHLQQSGKLGRSVLNYIKKQL
jgi:hypothetical protein